MIIYMNAIKKILSWVFLVITIISLGYFAVEVYEVVRIQNASEAEKLSVIWQKDLEKLTEQKKLHPNWNRIREVVLTGGTKKSRNWLKKIGSPVKVTSKGDHRLEVLLLDWEHEGDQGAMVQYNLVDLKSGNMIWELGRTFTLKKADRKNLDQTLISKPVENSKKAPTSESNKPSPTPTSSPAESSSP